MLVGLRVSRGMPPGLVSVSEDVDEGGGLDEEEGGYDEG